MDSEPRFATFDHLPFWITEPGSSDMLLGAVAVTLLAIIIGFGALYFTIQAIPDRIAQGTSKAQMQVVGLLGLISLFTMNNLYWVVAILLAAVRIPDFVSPLKAIAASLEKRESTPESAGTSGRGAELTPAAESPRASAESPESGEDSMPAMKDGEQPDD